MESIQRALAVGLRVQRLLQICSRLDLSNAALLSLFETDLSDEEASQIMKVSAELSNPALVVVGKKVTKKTKKLVLEQIHTKISDIPDSPERIELITAEFSDWKKNEIMGYCQQYIPNVFLGGRLADVFELIATGNNELNDIVHDIKMGKKTADDLQASVKNKQLNKTILREMCKFLGFDNDIKMTEDTLIDSLIEHRAKVKYENLKLPPLETHILPE